MLPTATKLSAGKDKSRAARCCAALPVSKCFGITTGRASAMLAYRARVRRCDVFDQTCC